MNTKMAACQNNQLEVDTGDVGGPCMKQYHLKWALALQSASDQKPRSCDTQATVGTKELLLHYIRYR